MESKIYELEGEGIIHYFPSFLSKEEADQLFETCRKKEGGVINWRQGKVKVGTRLTTEPRLTAFLGERTGLKYTYSEKLNIATVWPDSVKKVKEKIETVTAGSQFNVVLMNWYENGKHHVGWHSDSEEDLKEGSCIASLSLGCSRKFQLRHKFDSAQGALKQELGLARKNGKVLSKEELKILGYQVGVDPRYNTEILLNHGDLLLMKGKLQKNWRHRVPPVSDDISPRICMTFRCVVENVLS
eukprot:TRINITY_DN5810_c0_g1_i4.p1 TRINITY_DN5810_c0_g1~~TRINITY_DN5810_c0_g1_i4.p1  ORF type:complete len:242 (+),score=34.20 TRINITY_DN5810_c0_g1_i4:27-752(+)